MTLSLENALELDRGTAERTAVGLSIPQNTFRSDLFRQPSLAEGMIRPHQQQMHDQAQKDPHYHIVKGSKILNDAGRIIATFKKGGSIYWGEAKESNLDLKEYLCDDTVSSVEEENYTWGSPNESEYVEYTTSDFDSSLKDSSSTTAYTEDLLDNDFVPTPILIPFSAREVPCII